MSYNIHHGVGLDHELNLERIADLITDYKIDIIGLQEVDRFFGQRSQFENQVQKLADRLGFESTYGANISMDPLEGHTKRREYGTAILSRFPIHTSMNIHLESYGKEQRGILKAEIQWNDTTIQFYNTHLALDPESRLAQINEIIEMTNKDTSPKILVGDFNTLPNSEDMILLLSKTNFVDSFQHLKDAYSIPANQPNRRIDYILTSPPFAHSNQKVIQTLASDHLPIMTEVTI